MFTKDGDVWLLVKVEKVNQCKASIGYYALAQDWVKRFRFNLTFT